MEKLVLIDGHSIINRAFYGLPDLTNAEGVHTGAVYGFLNILFRLLEEEKPDYLVVAFDEHAPTFRHEMFDAYKGTRKPMPEELRTQVPLLRQMLEAMKVCCISHAGWEADDILGTLAKKAQKAGMEVSLVSGDRDLLQISDEHIKIRIPRTKMGRTTIDDFYPADVQAAYQVTPAQFIELKALMGDTADNIPGVPKVGEKTATELMVTYGSIDNIYAHLEEIGKKSIRESLEQNRELADLSLKLATIKTDCDLELDPEAAKAEGFFTPQAYELARELEFKNLLGRFEAAREEVPVETNDSTETSLCSDLKAFSDAFLALPEPESGYYGLQILCEDGIFCGISISTQSRNLYYAGQTGEEDRIRALLLEGAASERRYSVCGIKKQYPILSEDGKEIPDPGRFFDVLIAAYLIDPLKSDFDYDSIWLKYRKENVPSEKDLFGKLTYRAARMASPDALQKRAVLGSRIAFLCAQRLRKDLTENGMLRIMEEIEMPLSYVLYDMERLGVSVRRDELTAYGASLTGRIEELEKQICEEAGETFNILSPKQLGEILFEKMGLPGGKKTKTGYSTAADVLEKLAPEVPFVKKVLEYRGLTKLKSTYAEGLAAFIAADGRIHTTFHQTITATGRISSADPNLQNIPIRTELGRQLRKVFVPAEGFLFVDADYSQIELRVLASLSGDESLIDAYRSSQDIHRITASKVFHIPFEEVTDLQRRNAKAVNFGIVYGISSFGLSQDLSISRKEAEQYIKQYFETYPGIKAYLDKLVSDAKEKGYSETYYGRRRPIPELKNSNFMTRSFGERVAMNAPIQGTAADIMKIAMLKVWREIRERGLQSRLLLQVHDELVIETKLEEKEIVEELLERNMRTAADLAVTLEVGLGSGENWYDAH